MIARPIARLTIEEEQALFRRWRDHRDQAARDRLVLAFGPLVSGCVRRYRGYRAPHDDLVQEGTMALIEALERFDPDRGLRFSTYAVWWVRAAVRGYILRNASVVAPSRTVRDRSLFFKLRHVEGRIAGRNGGLDAVSRREQAASELSVRPNDVERIAVLLSGRDHSLDAPIGEDGRDGQATLPDERPSPEEQTVRTITAALRTRSLSQALDGLNARERLIVERHRLAEPGATLEQLGATLGVSKERVRQIEKSAMAKLRDALEEGIEDPVDYFEMA